jgi:surface carbohydrate biosynthesis protein
MADRATTVIIPIENQVRELDAKLLLGCVAAERGFPVILGSRTYVHFEADSIPRGVYLAKSMRPLSDPMFSILRELGHEIVAFDEEGLLRPSDARYYKRRMSAASVEQVSALLAWGPDNAETFERFPAARNIPVHVTGNPRIDMLRPEVRPFYAEQVQRIRERHGRIILLNSNFGVLNHYVSSMRPEAPGSDPLDSFMTSLTDRRKVIYQHFRKLIPEVASAFPEHTLLIRPHPVESHEPWLELASGHSNIVVDNEGSVLPWLMASEVLVQSGCQTAIEGALLGTPVVSFRPVPHELDSELIECLCHQVVDISALLETLRSIVAGELGPNDHPDRQRTLERHIAALDGPLASERMVDVLEEVGYGDRPPRSSTLPRQLRGQVRNRVRTAWKRSKMRKRQNRNSQDYHDHRYPELSLDDVRGRVVRLGEQLGRFEGLRVQQLSHDLLQING